MEEEDQEKEEQEEKEREEEEEQEEQEEEEQEGQRSQLFVPSKPGQFTALAAWSWRRYFSGRRAGVSAPCSLRLSRWQPSGALPGLQGHGCALQELVDDFVVFRNVRYPVSPVSRSIHLRRGADRCRAAV